MSNQGVDMLGMSMDGIPVFLDWSNTNVEYHLLETPDLIDLVVEALPTIEVSDHQQVVVERNLGRIVGTTNLVETTNIDEIVYAKRIGRNSYSRFVMNRELAPCDSIVVVLRKADSWYQLWTAMCGKLLPKEAWIKDSHFNKTHAMVFDEKLVQLDSVCRSRPLNQT